MLSGYCRSRLGDISLGPLVFCFNCKNVLTFRHKKSSLVQSKLHSHTQGDTSFPAPGLTHAWLGNLQWRLEQVRLLLPPLAHLAEVQEQRDEWQRAL